MIARCGLRLAYLTLTRVLSRPAPLARSDPTPPKSVEIPTQQARNLLMNLGDHATQSSVLIRDRDRGQSASSRVSTELTVTASGSGSTINCRTTPSSRIAA